MDIDGVTPTMIKQSLDLKENRDQVFRAGEGAGASGSFFFFSKDGRFLIKTLRGDEKDILLRMLPSFIKHLKNNDN
jgi:hypothetical protein